MDLKQDSDLIKQISKWYPDKKEGLHLAEGALKDLMQAEDEYNLPEVGKTPGRMRKNQKCRTVGLAISPEFIKKGGFDLRGREIRGTGDLALLAQVFRNPRFETLRIFYVKEDTIVGHQGVTSRLPGACIPFTGLPTRERFLNEEEYLKAYKNAINDNFKDIEKTIKSLEADGYYLLHNHPSGEPRPSREDIVFTERLGLRINGFKGHVVINSNKYATIMEPDKGFECQVKIHDLDLGKDRLLAPSIPHPLLGERVSRSQQLAAMAKSMQLSSAYDVVIYADSKMRTRAIQEVHTELFKDKNQAITHLRKTALEFGCKNAFLCSMDDYPGKNAVIRELINEGYLTDAAVKEKNQPYLSLRENGVGFNQDEDGWMGMRVDRGRKVNDYGRKRCKPISPSFDMGL